MGFNSQNRASVSTAVTPTDDLAVEFDALYIGTGGTVVCKLIGDSTASTFVNVASGTTLAYCVKEVLSTGTTATDIVGLRVNQ